MAIVKVRNM